MLSLTSSSRLALVLALALAAVGCAQSVETEEVSPVGTTAEALGSRPTGRLAELGDPTLAELDDLYASGTTEGGLPEGRAAGRAFFLGLPGFRQLEETLAASGRPVPSRLAENFIANAIWKGKTFRAVENDPTRIGELTNQVFGFDLATADIHQIDASDDADEANTFYLDYSHSDFAVVRGVQDYIRKIGPGLYIGKAFLKIPGTDTRALACYFALDFAK